MTKSNSTSGCSLEFAVFGADMGYILLKNAVLGYILLKNAVSIKPRAVQPAQ